jgi:AcrR family transcriptional regulator
MESAHPKPTGPGKSIRQRRSRKTYDALVRTGFDLLERREFESITIAELTSAASYSVGAFYARFRSKDEFFEALVAHHIVERREAREQLLASTPADTLVEALIDNLVTYYWRRRQFWRAALLRSTYDTIFWEPIRKQAQEFMSAVIARIEKDIGHRLTKTERHNVTFAFQLVLGTINNLIVNRPDPESIGQASFVKDLVRAFGLVSEYDKLPRATKLR